LFFFSSRRRHTRFSRDWSSDVCSSDLRARTGRLSYRTTVGGKYEELPLGKTVRYYLSNSGGSIMKIYHTEKKVKQKDISVNQMSLFGATDTVTTIVDKPVSAHVGRKMTLFQRWVDI